MPGKGLRRLTLNNYGLFKDQKIDIPRGISLVFGYWEDNVSRSNGAGKSLFVSSIMYAFTGKANRLPWQSSYSVKFDTERYSIYREKKSGKHSVEFVYEDQAYRGRVSDVSAILEDYFGNYESLSALYFALEGSQLDFWKMTPSARYSFLSDVFNLGSVDDYKQKAQILVRTDKNVIKELSSEYNLLQDNIKRYENLLSSVSEEDLLKRKKEIEEKLAVLKKSYESKKALVEKTLSLVKKRDKLRDEYHSLQKKLERQKAQLDVWSNEIKELEQKEKELEAVVDKYNAVDFDERIRSLKEKESSVLSRIEDIKLQLRSLKEKAELLNKGKCPTCGRAFTTSDINEFKQVDNSANLKAILSVEEDKLRTIHSDVERVIQAKAKFSEIKNKYNEIRERLAQLRTKVAGVNTQSFRALENLQKEYESVHSLVKDVDLNAVIAEQNSLKDNITELEKEIKDIENKLNTIALYKQEMDNVRSRLQDLDKKLQKINKQIPYEERISYYFSSGVVIRTLLGEVLEYVEDFSNSFLVNLGSDLRVAFGFQKELKSGRTKPEIQLKAYRGDNEISPSSGESALLSIALRVAFASLHKKLDFFVFDESFAFLDDYNAGMVLDALYSILDYGYYGVIIVSNKQLLRDLASVNRIVIRRQGDESVVFVE